MVSHVVFALLAAAAPITGDFEQVSYNMDPDPAEHVDEEVNRFHNDFGPPVNWPWVMYYACHFIVTGIDDQTEPWASAPWSLIVSDIADNHWSISGSGTVAVPTGYDMVYWRTRDQRNGHETLKHIPTSVERTRNLSQFVIERVWVVVELHPFEPMEGPG